MARKPPSLFAVAITSGAIVIFVAWTLMFLFVPRLERSDLADVAAPLDPASGPAQLAAAFALLTWPGVVYAGMLGIALWAIRHRLRNLSAALVLAVVIGWGGEIGVKLLVRRDRPAQALDLLTAYGYSYPSGHLVAMVAFVILMGATLTVTRQSRQVRLGWAFGGSAIVLAVGFDRWLLSANYVSDLVGGVLFGVIAASLALIAADVRVIPQFIISASSLTRVQPPAPADSGQPLRCAVIYNPVKVTDWATFRRHVEYELRTRGWERPLWLETTQDDPGREMTARAVAERVDLVLAAGGDGTIRVVCSGLADSGIPFGLIPAGTGNLLAKNVGIPLDEREALRVAFEGVDRPIDVVRIVADDNEDQADHFMVMAGIGIDAVIMQSTNTELKRAVGSAAYFVAAARNANHPALHTTIQVDDQPVIRRRAHVLVIGNVGFLQANIPLIPDAKPDDGLLDVLVASPRGLLDWLRLIARVLTRQRRTDNQLDRLTGRKVTIRVQEGDQYQLDGDTVGHAHKLTAEVLPGGLIIRSPR
ncbi:hypothetical protein GCM10009841_02740 [Microlunatus panaciterrae]|uniref:YegS/Rv2252/BmrU family lipid kinase n=1 Tax=Microlunatus panaciterrae TaxID=400768 RepID=A0ABS2RJ82_9ACTN|nr:diacylglycerol kinase family protein [Microlunatus panaciterrae]MBM7799064.1 YegS/Rv2252/BmrU family lipid kinase [Microlunatus panaciterrae]